MFHLLQLPVSQQASNIISTVPITFQVLKLKAAVLKAVSSPPAPREDLFPLCRDLQTELRLHVSILLTDPGSELRRRARQNLVKAGDDLGSYATDLASALSSRIREAMGVTSCGRHATDLWRINNESPATNAMELSTASTDDDVCNDENDESMSDVEPSNKPSTILVFPPNRKRKPLSKINGSAASAAADPNVGILPALTPTSARPTKRARKSPTENQQHQNSLHARLAALEVLERNRKVPKNDGLYKFVLWREALRAERGSGGAREDSQSA